MGEAGRSHALARAAVDRRAGVAACEPGRRIRRGKPWCSSLQLSATTVILLPYLPAPGGELV